MSFSSQIYLVCLELNPLVPPSLDEIGLFCTLIPLTVIAATVSNIKSRTLANVADT